MKPVRNDKNCSSTETKTNESNKNSSRLNASRAAYVRHLYSS